MDLFFPQDSESHLVYVTCVISRDLTSARVTSCKLNLRSPSKCFCLKSAVNKPRTHSIRAKNDLFSAHGDFVFPVDLFPSKDSRNDLVYVAPVISRQLA